MGSEMCIRDRTAFFGDLGTYEDKNIASWIQEHLRALQMAQKQNEVLLKWRGTIPHMHITALSKNGSELCSFADLYAKVSGDIRRCKKAPQFAKEMHEEQKGKSVCDQVSVDTAGKSIFQKQTPCNADNGRCVPTASANASGNGCFEGAHTITSASTAVRNQPGQAPSKPDPELTRPKRDPPRPSTLLEEMQTSSQTG